MHMIYPHRYLLKYKKENVCETMGAARKGVTFSKSKVYNDNRTYMHTMQVEVHFVTQKWLQPNATSARAARCGGDHEIHGALINNVFSVRNFVPGYIPVGDHHTDERWCLSIVLRHPGPRPAVGPLRKVLRNNYEFRHWIRNVPNKAESRPAIPLLIQLVLDAYWSWN